MNATALPLLFSMITIAFLGSWHCAAMCGPIAIAMGQKHSLWPYQVGRGISYLSVGALAGWFGKTILLTVSQNFHWAGLILLSTLLLLTLFPMPAFVHAQMGWLFQKVVRLRSGPFLFGLCSVLLPCGWLWTFVAAAAATGRPSTGLLVTGILWLSSLPALSLATGYFRSSLRMSTPQQAKWCSRGLVFAGLYSLWGHWL